MKLQFAGAKDQARRPCRFDPVVSLARIPVHREDQIPTSRERNTRAHPAVTSQAAANSVTFKLARLTGCDIIPGSKTLRWQVARIGYARVSSTDQDLSIQLARLHSEGCDIVRSEKVSGASRDGRSELATVIAFLRSGDEVVVARLDRLGRDTRDVLNIVHEVEQKGAHVTVLDPHISTRSTTGHMLFTVLGMVAQMERRFMKDRQRDGIARAKAEGVYKGGSRRLNYDEIRAMHASGHGPAAIARALHCSRMQVYRVIGSPVEPHHRSPTRNSRNAQ